MESPESNLLNIVEHTEKALVTILEAKKNENVKVVTDDETKLVADVFAEACENLGLSTTLILLGNRKEKGFFKEIPSDIRKEMNHPDIYINTFKSYPEETPFRMKLLELEMERGARIAHAPGIDMDILLGGVLSADFDEMLKRAELLMENLNDAVEIRVTTHAGTDIVLKVKERIFQTDLKIRAKELGNIPAGEIWCAPLEDGADGIAVIDGTIGDFGFPPSPVKIHLSKGRAVSVECEDEEFKNRLENVLRTDDMSDVIGELGIGLNEGAKLIGNMLVDEKAAGTVHIAFGNNIDFYGGINNSSMHRDFLMHAPDMVARYPDGSVRKIMENGNLIL